MKCGRAVASSIHETAQLEQLPEPAFERRGERQAFVDVVRFLVANGVLRFIDGDEDEYVSGTNDALYDVDQRIVANLLSTGIVPGAAPDDTAGDAGVYAESSDGATLRMRHRVMRMLCENPVLYYGDLADKERRLHPRRCDSQRHLCGAGWFRPVQAVSRNAEKHRLAGAAWNPAVHRTELLAPRLPADAPDDIEAELQSISKQMDDITAQSPQIPEGLVQAHGDR